MLLVSPDPSDRLPSLRGRTSAAERAAPLAARSCGLICQLLPHAHSHQLTEATPRWKEDGRHVRASVANFPMSGFVRRLDVSLGEMARL